MGVAAELRIANVVLAYRSPETVVFVSPYDFAEGVFSNLRVEERKCLLELLDGDWGEFREAVRRKERSYYFGREPEDIFTDGRWSSNAVSARVKPSSGLVKLPPGRYHSSAKGIFSPDEGFVQFDCGCPRSVVAGSRDEPVAVSTSCAHSAGLLVAFYNNQLGRDGPAFKEVHDKDDERVPFIPFIFDPMQAGRAVADHYLGGRTQRDINLGLLDLGAGHVHAAVRTAYREHRARLEGIKQVQEGMDTPEYRRLLEGQRELEEEGFVRRGIWVAPDGRTAGWNFVNQEDGLVCRYFGTEKHGLLRLAGSYRKGTFKLPKFDPGFVLEPGDQGKMTDTWNGMELAYEIQPVGKEW